MPDLSATYIILLAAIAAVGATAGWVLRGRRAEQEKAAVSAGWQEQIEAQRKESGRLVDQNKSLMEQVSQFQAQHNDARNRAKELSLAVQEAFARRDELQREIKDVRNSLETVLNERDQLASDMQTRGSVEDTLREKDERIDKLTRELENWQNRLPPLIERYRVRNEEAERAEAELEMARARIRELEESAPDDDDGGTRIEPVNDAEELTDGLDASNDATEDSDDELETQFNEAFSREASELPNESEVPDDDGEQDDELQTEPRDRRDNLKMIKGVGPAIEKTLNEMGIFSFQQIADMSEYDIDRVARRLKGFHSRIQREDWIGQARLLLDQAAHA